ncbi:MAG: hypothetical protein PHU30_06285 [Oscillospiraceae bacterium]|nr:hypothetical protein [Oscillospiraceae bacterium]
MNWKDLIFSIRDYPQVQHELAQAEIELDRMEGKLEQAEKALGQKQYELTQLRSENTRLVYDCSELKVQLCNQRTALGRAKKQEQARTALFRDFYPAMDNTEQYKAFYERIAPWMDEGGYALYRTAERITGFDICTEFPAEDNLGYFEEMNGQKMLTYLTASRFGTVKYETISPCYEKAVSLHTDTSSSEYKNFIRKLYAETLKELGYTDLLPEIEKISWEVKPKNKARSGRER